MKRIRKPPVTLEIRRNWLRRNEENNESPPQIAAQDGFDVRTVRKQLDLAKQERETHEARSIVLRNALEQHYRDLLSYAEILNHQIFGLGTAPPLQDPDLIEAALRQHLPRSPVWNLMSKLGRLKSQIETQRLIVTSSFEKMVKSDQHLSTLTIEPRDEIISRIIDILCYEAGQWSHGNTNFDLSTNPVIQPAGEGFVNIRYDRFTIDNIEASYSNEIIQTVQTLSRDLESRFKNSEGYGVLEKLWAELEYTRRKLREELAVIRLRRIVPGRCRYCPL